jgi:hypothetical protein
MIPVAANTVGIEALRVNSSFANRFEAERALAQQHLQATDLPPDLLNGSVMEVLRIARLLNDDHLKGLIKEGEALLSFQSTELASLPQKLFAAQLAGVATLSDLKVPSEIPREQYIANSREYLEDVDRAITRALKEKREEAELLKTFGYSTFALKIDLLRDLPFSSERLGVSRGGPSFVILLRDSGWRTVTRAEITVDIDRKLMRIDDLDASAEWQGKGIGAIFARNLCQVAAQMGMRQVVLGGGKSNGARFWSLMGGDIADMPIRWDRDMHGNPAGPPYYGLTQCVAAIKNGWASLQLRFKDDSRITSTMAHYQARVEGLLPSTASEFIRTIAADRTSLQRGDARVPFGKLFFDESSLRFSCTFNLEEPETWRRIHAYSRHAIHKRRLAFLLA